jgi:hypothetical protein
VLSLVLLRIDQPVNDIRLVFALHLQLARRSASADRKQHGGGSI